MDHRHRPYHRSRRVSTNDRSSDDDNDKDCYSIEQSLSSSYILRTINDHNRNRQGILPIFPTTADHQQQHLLLPNVPAEFLSKEELLRRTQNDLSTPPFQVKFDYGHYRSHLLEYYQQNYLDLIQRLHVPACILDCNYIRLGHCLNLFAEERIRHLRASFLEVQLPEQERSLAMEFFLQIDVDVFYMRPSSSNRSFFCQKKFDVRFATKPCRKCGLCCLPYYSIGRPPSPLDFHSSGKYIFRNGYEAILNANASCQTNNIIYVLKCVCDQCEYVGETNLTLTHRLSRIQEASLRYIQEFLLGEKNFDHFHRRNGSIMSAPSRYSNQTASIDLERFYQHLVRCPAVMQRFLEYNPRYWRFVPMPIADETGQDTVDVPAKRRKTDIDIQQDDQLETFLDNLPVPPSGYEFSVRQREQQSRFFRKEYHTHLPKVDVHLYKAIVITVLPKEVSIVFRQFIQALFITHGETNLNCIGHLVTSYNNNNNNNDLPSSLHIRLPRGEWCRNLVHPS